ncbi:MAG: FHA domain-containing protein [Crocinitomicaceae bacterium]|nr:FHA domain-containing protein [Crocinitomicaceae bacterium]MCF8433521.1 FHA domain-containing protein [Crocinitomicaceae bacterium]
MLDHITISRVHAEFFVDPESNVFLSDLNSSYGTFVNAIRIAQPVLLVSGDIVSFGDEQFFDWEYQILGKEPIRKLTSAAKKNKNLIKDNLDIVLIYGLILLMLFILSFLLG